jgi:hypothetical protein
MGLESAGGAQAEGGYKLCILSPRKLIWAQSSNLKVLETFRGTDLTHES